MGLETRDLRDSDILLYKSDNLVGRLIRSFDNAEVSHAGLYVGNGLVGEALIMGNPGLHRNPITESVTGCHWVEAARLKEPCDLAPVLTIADSYLNQGNRYAYEQVLMLAMILLTRRLDQSNWLVRQIADRTLRGCAGLLQRWREEGREPMTCSEFVFRTYDEAVVGNADEFTIQITAQGAGLPRRVISRRRRLRLFGAPPSPASPAVHPDSLLANLLEHPLRVASAPMQAAPAKTAVEIEQEIELPAREYLGDAVPLRASSNADGDLVVASRDDVEAAAAVFAQALIDAERTAAASLRSSEFGAAELADADDVEQLKRVTSDFITPGDLHRSSSLSIAGRLSVEGSTK